MTDRPERILRAATLIAAMAVVLHLAMVPLAEHDLFFHLKIGQLVLERHAIPFRNLFSFTYPDHVDPDLSWGFQVAVALLHRAGGFTAIVLFKVALIAAAFALAARASLRAGAGALATALAMTACALAAEPRLVERPHLVTFVGLGALELLLAEEERGRARALWWTPPLVLVWSNFHAGVFLAPLVLTAWGVGARLDGRRSRALSFAAPAAALMFVTPAGTRLVGYLGWHTGLGATRIVDEFRRADAWNDPWFFVLAAACLALALTRAKAVGWRRILPTAMAALLAWRSVRFVAEWAFIAMPLLALGATELGRDALTLLEQPRAAWRVAYASFALAIGIVVGSARARQPLALGLAGDLVPFAAIDFATREGLRDRLYADLDVGCYLLWEGWPRYQVFQDARLPAYPEEFHRALDETPLEPSAFDALLRRYGVDAALLADPDVNMRAGSFDPDEWALVWRSPDALLFVRRVARFTQLIARRELPLRLTFRFEGGAHAEPISRPPARSPVDACTWQRRLATALDELGDPERALDARTQAFACLPPDEEAETRYRLGARLQAKGRLHAAVAEYDRALGLRPQDARVLANRGYAHLLSDPRAAQADFTRALELDAARADVRAQLHALGR